MKIAVILGSTREGRIGERAAKWAAREVEKDSADEAVIVDLRDYEMPFFDEAISPQYNPNRQPKPAVQKWLDQIADADGYIIVTPEYNRSFPGVLKNALDYIAHEAANKPVAVVSYSPTHTGGEAANVQLRPILSAVRMLPVPTYVVVSVIGDTITEEGETATEVAARPFGPHTAVAQAVSEIRQLAGSAVAA